VWRAVARRRHRVRVHLRSQQIEKTHRRDTAIVAMAEIVGTIGAVVGLVDIIAKAFGHVKSAFHATSEEQVPTVESILNICQEVKRISEQGKTFNFPYTLFSIVENNLKIVSEIAEKYKISHFVIASSTCRKH
jgi:hypothetical protein